MGITLGDLEEPFTVEAILSSPAQPAARIAALEEYVGMTRQTAYGQLLDIRNGTLPPGTVTERDVLDVHRLKSAVYTVVVAAQDRCPARGLDPRAAPGPRGARDRPGDRLPATG